MKTKLIIGLCLVVGTVFGQGRANMQIDTKTHQLVEPAASSFALYDYDFTGRSIGGLTIGPALISDQIENTAPASTDFMLGYDPVLGQLFKTTNANWAAQLVISQILDPVTGFGASYNTGQLTANSVINIPDAGPSGSTSVRPLVPVGGFVVDGLATDGTLHTVAAGGGGGTPGGSNGQVQFNNAGSFDGLTGLNTAAGALVNIDVANADTTISRGAAGQIAVEGIAIPSISSNSTLTNKTIDAGQFSTSALFSSAPITISGNISSAAWTTNGLRLKTSAATLTDTTSTGTVTAAYTNVFGGNTIAASSATTFTDYYTTYGRDPAAGTNVTLTNKWGIGAESAKFGTSNPFSIANNGHVTVEGVTSTGATGTGGFVFNTAPTISTIELGATDTTLSRGTAGHPAAEGVAMILASDTVNALAASTSANLRTLLSDENGTGVALFDAATTPTFTTGIQIGGAAASGKILKGNGTNFVPSTETYAAPGTSGNVLTSDGTNWTSATPAGAGLGYVLGGETAVALAPADVTTYFFGFGAGIAIAQHATYANGSITVPKAGTIKRITWKIFVVTNGTNEATTHILRLNDTTDTSLSTSETYDPGANTQKTFTYTGLSIAVAVGDTISFKITTPTWTTNPTFSSSQLQVYIE